MNAEDLVATFKRDMAKLSGAERRRAIESVRTARWPADRPEAIGPSRLTRPILSALPPCRIQTRQGGEYHTIAKTIGLNVNYGLTEPSILNIGAKCVRMWTAIR